MKYAYIALVACYLLTASCSPEPEKKAEHAASGHATVAAEHVATDAHKAPVAHKADAAQSAEAATAAPETAAVEEAPLTPWQQIAKNASNNVMALMNGEASLPTPVTEEEQPAAAEPVAEAAQPAHPCPRKPTASTPCNMPCPLAQQQQAAEPVDLSSAMQRMVKATNDMIFVTNQLVAATEQILDASQGAAAEMVATGKQILAEKQAEGENTVMETVQGVVDATKEVIEATNQALKQATEKQQ